MTGGGTGGHIIPNIAIIEGLKKKPDLDLLYIGSRDGVEKSLITKLGVRYEGISCGKLRRYFSWKNFIDIFRIPVGICQAKKILRDFDADVVFSKGGYVSVPVVLAAHKLRIPIIVHESDVSPGLANKIGFRYADKICIGFKETKSYISKIYEEDVVFTGNPIREEILQGNSDAGYKYTMLDHHKPVILIMGGSSGAMQINGLVRASLDELSKHFHIVHITGKGNLDLSVRKNGYVQYEYLDEQLKDVYAMAEMVVTRGGANSLAELALLKKKVLIIPLGFEGSRGEQTANSVVFVREFGWSMLSGEITREDFIDNINFCYRNEINSHAEFKNGTHEICNLILKTAS